MKKIHKVDKPNFAYRQKVIRCEQTIASEFDSPNFKKVNCYKCLNLKGKKGYK